MKTTLPRLRSIDAFRAVTMFLMIFVNDIEDIPNTPQWMHHVADEVDGMGLADIIFPAFLFIVGLSIPFALQKGSVQNGSAKWHIVKRSAILMFWGFWFTNTETYNADNTILEQGAWQYLSIVSMFLIFLDYSWVKQLWVKYMLQAIGVVLLLFLSAVYRSIDAEQPWLHFTWWGILGLIGWAYLFGALIFYFSAGRLWVQVAAWALFVIYNLFAHLGYLDFMYQLYPYIWLAGNGAMQAFTMAGIIVAAFYKHALTNNSLRLYFVTIIAAAAAIMVFGFIVRDSTGGLSKAFETPAWVTVCIGLCMLAYLVFVYIVDIKNEYNWIKPIEAAGIATLTCFMLPDIFYSWFETTDFDYPDVVKDGVGGVVRGIIFTFLTIWATALLLKLKIRLKI